MIFKVFQFLFGVILLFPTLGFAKEHFNLRSKSCEGLLVSNGLHPSEGIYRSKLDLQSIEAYLSSTKALEELSQDKTLNVVGLPLIGPEKRKFKKHIRELIKQHFPGLKIKTRFFSRPRQPGLYLSKDGLWLRVAPLKPKAIKRYFEKYEGQIDSFRLVGVAQKSGGRYFRRVTSFNKTDEIVALTQQLVEQEGGELEFGNPRPVRHLIEKALYLLPQRQDIQSPAPEELSAGAVKLALTTPLIAITLGMNEPLAVAVPAVATNFIRSGFMAVYSSLFSNWFSRSGVDQHFARLAKSFGITAATTIPLYWATRGAFEGSINPEGIHELGFADILTPAGWALMASQKWTAVLFQVLWKFFLYNGGYKWEKNTKKKADRIDSANYDSETSYLEAKTALKSGARATRSRVEMLATVLATPFYLMAAVSPESILPSSLGLEYGVGHLGMTVIGIAGGFLYFKPSLLDKFNLPEKIEKIHQGVLKVFSSIGLRALVEWADRQSYSLKDPETEEQDEEEELLSGESE